MKKVRITNIQRFCLQDGPGIRTTVFLKGCNLHCPWCSNPENMSFDIQSFKDPIKKIQGTYGRDISLENLKKELLKDKTFFVDGGGITFSGGEPLLQLDHYESLLKELKEEHIHLTIETALYVKKEVIRRALPYFDLWIIDIKSGTQSFNNQFIGGCLEDYLENLKFVLAAHKKIWLRFPAIDTMTLNRENVDSLISILKTIHYDDFQILEGHNLGKSKYLSLGMDPIEVTSESISYLKEKCEQEGLLYHVLTL